MKHLPYILIAVVLFLSAGFYLDRTKKTAPERPALQTEGKIPGKLKNFGPTPDFTGITQWLNTDQPLKLSELKGKVVLVDFWTYSCINCIRTLPFVSGWYEKYKDRGFVVVGVHTPEFEFEKDTDNVKTALQRHNITYPVAQDNNFATWQAYKNRYWPAHYLIDQNGDLRYYHFGEGKYDEMEMNIRALLGAQDQPLQTSDEELKNFAATPEIYFGLDRLQFLHPAQNTRASRQTNTFTLPESLQENNFALEGAWKFDGEKAVLEKGPGKLRLNFEAKNVFMVARSQAPQEVTIRVDGASVSELEISESKLYDLNQNNTANRRILEIEIPEAGFEIFTFTFG